MKNYLFKPLNSENKPIIELAFVIGHYVLIADKTALPVTKKKKQKQQQKLFDTDLSLKLVSNLVASNLEDSWA